MKPYFVKTPSFFKRLFPSITWDINTDGKLLYLTFDDGPVEGVTNWVLDILKQYNAKATFFCVGDNITKHPHIYKRIIDEGNSVGNHTHNHLKGLNTKDNLYLENIDEADSLINSKLFRPPHGLMKLSQFYKIKKDKKIILWDVLSADFDNSISPEKCYNNVIKNATNGSIIVFHDSMKAEERLKYSLPKVLKHFTDKGYKFKAI